MAWKKYSQPLRGTRSSAPALMVNGTSVYLNAAALARAGVAPSNKVRYDVFVDTEASTLGLKISESGAYTAKVHAKVALSVTAVKQCLKDIGATMKTGRLECIFTEGGGRSGRPVRRHHGFQAEGALG